MSYKIYSSEEKKNLAEQFIKLKNEGQTDLLIAQQLNISIEALKRWARKYHGFRKKDRLKKASKSPKTNSLPVPILESNSDTSKKVLLALLENVQNQLKTISNFLQN